MGPERGPNDPGRKDLNVECAWEEALLFVISRLQEGFHPEEFYWIVMESMMSARGDHYRLKVLCYSADILRTLLEVKFKGVVISLDDYDENVVPDEKVRLEFEITMARMCRDGKALREIVTDWCILSDLGTCLKGISSQRETKQKMLGLTVQRENAKAEA